MKSYPITDYVPEDELTAITPDGAARWLTARSWTHIGQATRGHWWIAPGYVETNHDAPAALLPVADLLDYAKSTAAAIGDIAREAKVSPRTIIAEMQADSRIAAECARMAGKKKETA